MYADQVNNIRDKLAQLQEQKIENYDDMANGITEKYNDKMKDFTEKWKAVSEAGGEELSGLIGAKSIYAGGKKLVDLYRGRQTRKKEAEQKKETEDDFDEDAEPLDIGGDDSLKDFKNDNGDTYFKGSDGDHQEFYDDDAQLKDPTSIPEGHQFQPDQEGVDEEETNPFRMPDDIRPAIKVTEPDTLDPIDAPDATEVIGQPSFVSVVEQGQRDRQQRLQANDDAVDQPTQVSTDDLPEPSQPLSRPAQVDLKSNPFSENTGKPISSEFQPKEAPADENTDIIGGEQSGLQEVGGEGSSLLERTGQKAFSSLAQRGQSIKQGFSSVKNFFSSGGSEAAEVGGEAGSELAGLTASDAILGAIPVVGELALAVSGFVAIGEGIYHLFHPDKKPPAPAPSAPVTAPHSLTQKYAVALPSVDNAVDRSASVGTF